MWFLLASPFITALFSFMILSGSINASPTQDEKVNNIVRAIITGIFFALFMLIGFAICSGIFILNPISDREFHLRQLIHFIG